MWACANVERRGTHVMFGVVAWRGEICMHTRLYANLNEWMNAEHDSETKQAHPLATLIQTYLCSLFSGYLVGLVIVLSRLHFKAELLDKRRGRFDSNYMMIGISRLWYRLSALIVGDTAISPALSHVLNVAVVVARK